VIMSLSTLSLPVSPALKITDQGLIQVNEGKIVPLVVR
jgi:adenine deaminase